MKNDYIKIFLIITFSVIVAGLIFWGVTFVEETQHKLSVFAIVAVIFTTISSVYTVSYNNRKALRKELKFEDDKDLNVMSIILTAEARKELTEKGII